MKEIISENSVDNLAYTLQELDAQAKRDKEAKEAAEILLLQPKDPEGVKVNAYNTTIEKGGSGYDCKILEGTAGRPLCNFGFCCGKGTPLSGDESLSIEQCQTSETK